MRADIIVNMNSLVWDTIKETLNTTEKYMKSVSFLTFVFYKLFRQN